MKLLSLNSWQKTNGLFCVHMRRARDHRDDGETMGQRPGVTRCQWYIFVWISALRNPNGGHTLGKCAQIVIQWYFEGCIRNNMSQGPPNKHLCFMLSRYFTTFKHSALIWRIWIDQVWVKYDLASDACSPAVARTLRPRLHRQTITRPRPPGTFLPGLKQTLSSPSAAASIRGLKWEWETLGGRRELKHFHNVATE